MYRKFSTGADIFSCKMIIVTDITILFSDLVSLIVLLQTWNVKYYKYAIVTGFVKTVPNRTRIEIPFIAWHES